MFVLGIYLLFMPVVMKKTEKPLKVRGNNDFHPDYTFVCARKSCRVKVSGEKGNFSHLKNQAGSSSIEEEIINLLSLLLFIYCLFSFLGRRYFFIRSRNLFVAVWERKIV